jgi:hypothetical protein
MVPRCRGLAGYLDPDPYTGQRASKPCAETADCLLTDSPGQALGIANQHALILQLDPAAMGEIAERFVDSFARRPD